MKVKKGRENRGEEETLAYVPKRNELVCVHLSTAYNFPLLEPQKLNDKSSFHINAPLIRNGIN